MNLEVTCYEEILFDIELENKRITINRLYFCASCHHKFKKDDTWNLFDFIS